MDSALLISVYDSGGETTNKFMLGTSALLPIYSMAGTRHMVAKMHGARTGAVLTAEKGYELRQLDSDPAATRTEQDKASEHQFAIDPSKRAVYTAIYTAGDAPAGFSSGSGQQPAVPQPSRIYIRRSTRGMRHYQKVAFTSDQAVRFGSSPDSDMRYSHPLVSSDSFTLQLRERHFMLQLRAGGDPLYINGVPVSTQVAYKLNVGDVISLADLKIGIGDRFITINQPSGLEASERAMSLRPLPHKDIYASSPQPQDDDTDIDEEDNDGSNFFPAPRLMQNIHKRVFKLDAPPTKEGEKISPAIMQIGPSFMMGLASVFMAVASISRLRSGENIMNVLPTIAMAGAMVIGMIVWPVISNFYDRHRRKKAEEKRVNRFTDYLNRVETELRRESGLQAAILRSNRVLPETVMQRAYSRSPELMNRNSAHSDFMELRLGIGSEELKAEIKYPENKFTLDSDILSDRVSEMRKNRPAVSDVPIALDLKKDRTVGFVGTRNLIWPVLRGLMVQLSGLYSYDDVKIILIGDKEDSGEWDFARRLPHTFSDDRDMRFLACEPEDMIRVDRFLQKLYDERSAHTRSSQDTVFPGTYYVVFCTDRDLASRSPALAKWMHAGNDLGLSVIFNADTLSDLPSECTTVVNIIDPQEARQTGATSSFFYRDDVDGTSRAFICDIMVSAAESEKYASALSGVRMRQVGTKDVGLPTSLSYMDMQKVGNVGDLNVAERWRMHDASRTLATRIGTGAHGQPFILDLHEDSHGPHGLIAGTTGSGKSEFIITYILSMALDYAPDEAAFVLIDYKGGGLAGAFANGRFVLPHLSGTITNLDGSAINRSLSAIQSELQKRQRLFNVAREATGEPTMDIYKYLSYYRQGVVKDPMPHLFIVADEFAELKQQEPDFMDELISAARIGRSLGVHLILATQKPSGVVNDQIWSNSRFKVSLKVADGPDSKEMIRRPDAAELKNPGRFYLLVGFNDYFAQGQSAYTGTRYTPHQEFEEHHDDMVTLIGNTAEALASLKPQTSGEASRLTELDAVLEQICETADDMDIHAEQLWLDPLPDQITVDDFRSQYQGAISETSAKEADTNTCVAKIGIIDDPSRQNQHLLAVDFGKADNLVIYGQTSYGTESIVSTVFDSLIRDYSAEDVNIYGMDMGDGGLTAFNQAPQVGGVTVIDDREQVTSLMHFISRKIAHRRRVLNAFGERYDDYVFECRKQKNVPSGQTDTSGSQAPREPMPRVIVALTNIAAFNEAYPQFTDMLTDIAHEGPRYGIHFIVTSANFNQVGWRLRALFGMSLVTAFNNVDEYGSVFGSMSGVTPPQHYLRGLLLEGDEKHEYQAADAGTGREIRERCQELASNNNDDLQTEAVPIPRLPQFVTPDMFVGDAVGQERDIPLGYDKQQVYPFTVDGRKSPSFIITGNDAEALGYCATALSATFALISKDIARGSLVIDPSHMVKGVPEDAENFHLASDITDIDMRIQQVISGEVSPATVIFTDLLSTFAKLPAETKNNLMGYIERDEYRDTTNFVFVLERWRLENVYEPWMKAIRANPQGVWVGEGIKTQSIFPNTHMPPEMNQAQAQTDGWVFYRGGRYGIRLIHQDAEGGTDTGTGTAAGVSIADIIPGGNAASVSAGAGHAASAGAAAPMHTGNGEPADMSTGEEQ